MARSSFPFFFFNDTATTEIYTLSLHDALPIYIQGFEVVVVPLDLGTLDSLEAERPEDPGRSEEHTSELQSQSNLVCRLLLEKKKGKSSRYCTASLEACCLRCA